VAKSTLEQIAIKFNRRSWRAVEAQNQSWAGRTSTRSGCTGHKFDS